MATIYSGAPKAMAAPETQIQPRLLSSSATESTSELHNLDTSFRELAKFAGPAVVDIKTQSPRRMSQDGAREPVTMGEGSGFIFSPDGYIATNDHVVGNADTVHVSLKDGREFDGKVTRANDVNSDIALVKIDAKDLPYLSFADSSNVTPGEIAMAIGAPFGLENSVTVGHISALDRSNVIENHVYTDLMQTDAAINMGNSGGPLVNVDGQVIGMNTAIYSPTGGSNGIGFAIPSNQVRLIENLLVTKGKVVRSMIGIIPEDIKDFERKNNPMLAGGGARVRMLAETANNPAQAAGILKDDVIVKIGTVTIHSQEDLRNSMLAYGPGTNVPVEIVRNGKHKTLDVKLQAYQAPKELTQQPQNRMHGMPFDPFGGNPNMPGFPNFPGFPNMPNDNGDQNPPAHSDHTGHARLGVQVGNLDETTRSQFGIPQGVNGAVVVGVQPGTTAALAGVQPGDVIESLNGKSVSSADDLSKAMGGVNWGSTGHIVYERFANDGASRERVERDMKFQ